jgi:hypothetical protein
LEKHSGSVRNVFKTGKVVAHESNNVGKLCACVSLAPDGIGDFLQFPHQIRKSSAAKDTHDTAALLRERQERRTHAPTIFASVLKKLDMAKLLKVEPNP